MEIIGFATSMKVLTIRYGKYHIVCVKTALILYQQSSRFL